VLGRAPPPFGRRDYLGADVLRGRPSGRAKRFRVSIPERRALAAAWLSRAPDGQA